MKMKHSTLVAIATICLLVSACTKKNSPEEQPLQLTEEKSVAARSCCDVSIQINGENVYISTLNGNVELPSFLFDLTNVPGSAYNNEICVTPCAAPTQPEQKWKTETEAIVDAFQKSGQLPPPPCPLSPQTIYMDAQVQSAYSSALSYEGTARLMGETYNALVAPHSGPYLPAIDEFGAMAVHLHTMADRFFTFYPASQADYAFSAAASDLLVIAIYVDLGEAETGINRSRAAVLMLGYGNQDILTWPNSGSLSVSRAAGIYFAGDFFENDNIKANTVYFVYDPYRCH